MGTPLVHGTTPATSFSAGSDTCTVTLNRSGGGSVTSKASSSTIVRSATSFSGHTPTPVLFSTGPRGAISFPGRVTVSLLCIVTYVSLVE